MIIGLCGTLFLLIAVPTVVVLNTVVSLLALVLSPVLGLLAAL